jgi:hypothetical protein
VTIDTTPPAVTINQAAGQADPTSASPINFTAVFSEPVSGFTGADVAISGTAGGTKTVTVSGGPSTYNAAVSGMTTAGTVIAAIAAGVAQDAAGNANTASTSTDNGVTFNLPDTTQPTVTINQAATQADPTSASPINFTAVFSEAVSGFTGADVAISGTAGGTKTVTVSGGPSTYNVAVSGMTTAGTVIAAIAAGVAQDAAGNTNTASTSTDNTVSFDATAPTVAITSPASGATVSGTITVTASAADNVGVVGVQFQLDGVNAGAEVTAAPYSVPWNTTTASNGSHTITAVARDAAGNTTPSAPVMVTVANDTTAPTVTINQAAGQADPSNSAPINFTAVFSEAVSGTGADVMVTISGTAGGTKTVTVSGGPSTYNVAVSGMTTAGTVIATIAAGVAQDAAGNTNTASTSTDNTVSFDATAPTVAITSPASGATVSGTITVTAGAADNTGVVGVQFQLDGVNAGAEVTAAPYSVPWNTTTASNGSHTITAVARDAAGNTTTSAPVTVTVANDTTAPTVAITSPASGATVSGTISVNADAADNIGVAGVRFFVGILEIGVEDTTVPYEVSWNTTTLSDGTYTLIAVARDAAGNKASSTGITVTVSNGGPAVTRFEEDNPSISASPAGAWVQRGPEVAAFSGGTAGSSNVAEATVTFTFTGTAASWIGLKCSICGIATVSIDGGAAVSVDTAGPTAPGSPGLASEAVFTASGLAAGSHTMVITVTGITTSGGTHIVVDAFDVTGAVSAANRVEENNPEVSVAGAWVLRGAEVATFSGGSAGSSDVSGATATFTFTGTAVSWVGLRCSACGIANVSIDGGAANSVDTVGAAAPGSPGLASEAVFTASGLAAGTHTLVITVTGSTTSGGAHIVVDAFDVTP